MHGTFRSLHTETSTADGACALRLYAALEALLLIAWLTAAGATLPSTAAARELDPSFGSGGLAVTDLDPHMDQRAFALAIQRDGKLVVAGEVGDRFALLRYHSDGRLDGTFGTGGLALLSDAHGGSSARALLVQPDGKLVAAGFEPASNTEGVGASGFNIVVARYDFDGSPDATFGSDASGVLSSTLGGSARALALAADRDESLVVAGEGWCDQNLDCDAFIARLRTDGTLDPQFGGGGIVRHTVLRRLFPDGPRYEADLGAQAVQIMADGAIITAGGSYYAEPNFSELSISFHNPFGAIEASALLPIGRRLGDHAQANAAVVQRDGKLVLAGGARIAGRASQVAMLRYVPPGSEVGEFGREDESFGSGGQVVAAAGEASMAHALAVRPSGRIIVAGETTTAGDTDFLLLGLRANGQLDTGFDADGVLTTDFDAGDDHARALAVQRDGRLVVAGWSERDGARRIALARYLAGPCAGDCNVDGTVDISEMIVGVNVALGRTSLDVCPAFDCAGDGVVAISCLIEAVNGALMGCR